MIEIKKIEFDTEWFEDNISEILSPYSQEFAVTEYGRGIEVYLNRLKTLGLCDVGNVLDAGGGIGNWSIPLACLNNKVQVIDVSSERLLVGKLMADHAQVKNISFQYGSIDRLPYSDAIFDAIVCYSVIMFTDINKVLQEFHRVLKKGGKLYIMTDLWRWYIGGGLPKKGRAKHFLNLGYSRLRYSIPKYLSPQKINKLVTKAGFNIIDSGQDGHATFLNTTVERIHAFYPSMMEGKEELWEICALKESV